MSDKTYLETMNEMPACKTTRLATILSCVLSEPLVFCYALLVPLFIKELHATPLQIGVLVTMHPLISFIAMYWSYFSALKKHKLLKRVNLGHALAKLPWLALPFVSSPWAIIAIATLYRLFSSGSMPGWNEVMRIKLASNIRHRTFAFGMAGAYLVALVLTVLIAPSFSLIWKWAFFASALIGLISLPFQAAIELPASSEDNADSTTSELYKKNAINKLKAPWRKTFQVLKEDKPFRALQARIMLFGIAMMMAHPATAIYFVKILNLDYLQMSLLFTVCKGSGSLISAQAWGRLLNKIPMQRFATYTFLLFALFIALLPLGVFHFLFLPLAYFIRGITQSAVHLLWHLSGPHYSGPKESASYSSVNLMLLGVRGSFAPALGAAICVAFSPSVVLFFASALCLSAAALFQHKNLEPKPLPKN